MEYFFSQNKIFVLSKAVKENAFNLQYLNGQIFYNRDELGNFTQMVFKIFPLPFFEWKCKTGTLKVEPSFLHLNLNFDDFTCLKGVGKIIGKLNIKRNEIFGKLTLFDLKVKNIPIKVEKIKLTFFGKKFSGVISGGGLILKGGGNVKFDILKPQSGYIDATFTGNNIKLRIYGNIFNPKIVLR